MSIATNGSGNVGRTTALPSSSTAFTVCGWVRATSLAASSGYNSVCEISIPGTNQIHLVYANNGQLQVYWNYGAAVNTALGAPGLGTWVFWAMTQSGGTANVYWTTEASSTWTTAAQITTSAQTFTPTSITFGAPTFFGGEGLDGVHALMKVWNAALSSAQLLTQKGQTAPVTATNLLSSHLTDGPDLAADLVADAGGSTANLTSGGTGNVYSSAYPSFPAGSSVLLTGSATLPLTVPIFASPPPLIRKKQRRR